MDMHSKHTPGPWMYGALSVSRKDWRKLQPIGETAYGICGATLVVAISGFGNATKPEDEANARLIAAAPELLEALKHARSQMQHPDQMIDDAIAKAEGQA